MRYLKILFFLTLLAGCVEKEFDPHDPTASFAIAREPYDRGNFEHALTRLGEFKSRFPYSQHAAQAELLMADAHFQLRQFEEAAVTYEHFTKLHPRREEVPFAIYRVGLCYWERAQTKIDRDQTSTADAIKEWRRLIDRFPDSEEAEMARKLIAVGERRIADSNEFVAKFYCKRRLYGACAYRFILLAEEFPQYKSMRRNALSQAARALDILAKEKTDDPDSDKNIYFDTMTAEEIRAKAASLRQEAAL